MTMVPNLQSKMRWDILKDFEPVSLVATVEWGLIANNKAGFKSAADLIAAAKAAPGKIDYGSGGPGSPQHLAMAMFASAAGISLTHVPYKGATQAATDVAAGQIPVGFQGLGTVAALVRGGQLKLIGVTTEKRLPQFPDVPTVSESGLPGFFFNSWFAILAPAGTPKDIIARLNAEVLKAVGDPEVRRKLEELGFAVRGSSAEELARHDARSTRQICAGDQGNGNRQRISPRADGATDAIGGGLYPAISCRRNVGRRGRHSSRRPLHRDRPPKHKRRGSGYAADSRRYRDC